MELENLPLDNEVSISSPNKMLNLLDCLEKDYSSNHTTKNCLINNPKSKKILKEANSDTIGFFDSNGYCKGFKQKSSSNALKNSFLENNRVGTNEQVKVNLSEKTKKLNKKSFQNMQKPLINLELKEEKKGLFQVPIQDYLYVERNSYDIFISSIRSANDYTLLLRNKIKSIVSIDTYRASGFYWKFFKGDMLNITLDKNGSNTKKVLKEITNYIDFRLPKGNILICCPTGSSESCAAVIGYLISKYKLNYNAAYKVVSRERRSCSIDFEIQRNLEGLASDYF
ncbi:unnamed protein product [Blepharisma stoltei]|uniref:Dual specificity phosphatase catalytic domain-containing protein n=1 Tax=Blepharisma stoltei TaxID=1481888 RepID=A0AAU9K6Z8_9CILI|nr:unnamed protein product [Blepharisma stoltei]